MNRAVTVSTYRVKSLPSLAEDSRAEDRGAGGNPRAPSMPHRCPVRHEVPFGFRLVRVRERSGTDNLRPWMLEPNYARPPESSPDRKGGVRCLSFVNPAPVNQHPGATVSHMPLYARNSRPQPSPAQPKPTTVPFRSISYHSRVEPGCLGSDGGLEETAP